MQLINTTSIFEKRAITYQVIANPPNSDLQVKGVCLSGLLNRGDCNRILIKIPLIIFRIFDYILIVSVQQ